MNAIMSPTWAWRGGASATMITASRRLNIATSPATAQIDLRAVR